MISKTLRGSEGGRLGLIEAGAGAPLVLLHGVGMCAAAWAPQIEAFAPARHVFALDLPGHGGTDLLPGAPLLPDYVAWAAAAIRALGAGPVALAGHSMGALIALGVAVEHPDLLIVTSGGQGRDEWIPEGQAMRDYLIEKGLPADRVLAESKSTSTEENFAFSLDILKERGYSADTPIVYVSNAFHCYRAGRYAARAGFTTVAALPAHTPWRSVLPCYLREALALAYYWVFKTSTSGPMHAMVGLLDLNKRFFYK